VKRYKRASDILVGCIGYGGAFNMGRQHLGEMANAGMTPVAVCDIDESRLEVARQDFPGIETYNSEDAQELPGGSPCDHHAPQHPRPVGSPVSARRAPRGL